MTASSSEVMSAVKSNLDTASTTANSLGVSELLFLTLIRDQAEKLIRQHCTLSPECDI